MKPLEVFVYAFTIRKEGKRGKETNKPKNMRYAKVTKFVFCVFHNAINSHSPSFLTLKFNG